MSHGWTSPARVLAVAAYDGAVTDAGELEAALGRRLDATRKDQSGVVAVRLA